MSTSPQYPIRAKGPPVSRPIATIIAIDGVCAYQRFGVGVWYRAEPQDNLGVGDIVSTDEESVAAFEFVIGGKVGINRGSAIKIVGDRVAAGRSSDGTWETLALDSGTMWHKFFDQFRSRLIIRTRNSVLGPRG